MLAGNGASSNVGIEAYRDVTAGDHVPTHINSATCIGIIAGNPVCTGSNRITRNNVIALDGVDTLDRIVAYQRGDRTNTSAIGVKGTAGIVSRNNSKNTWDGKNKICLVPYTEETHEHDPDLILEESDEHR